MGYRAPSKKAIKDAIKADINGGSTPEQRRLIDFYRNVQETSMFGAEARVPGINVVVGPDAYTDRRWFAELRVDALGHVIGIK